MTIQLLESFLKKSVDFLKQEFKDKPYKVKVVPAYSVPVVNVPGISNSPSKTYVKERLYSFSTESERVDFLKRYNGSFSKPVYADIPLLGGKDLFYPVVKQYNSSTDEVQIGLSVNPKNNAHIYFISPVGDVFLDK